MRVAAHSSTPKDVVTSAERYPPEPGGAEGRVGTEEVAERGAAANQGRGDILDSRNGGGADCEGINRGGGLGE